MRHVALFYSVVLTKSRRIRSADLFAVAKAADLTPIKTVLSTGNLVFDADNTETALEARLEAATRLVLGKTIPIFVRSSQTFRAMLDANPFAAVPAGQVAARILRDKPSRDTMARLAACLAAAERPAETDRVLWVATPTPQSPVLRAAALPWVGPGTFRAATALHKIAASLA